MTTQTGPRLTIAGTCDGCCHLRTNVRDPRLGARLNAACVHPTRADGGTLFARSSKAPTMPADCPELPAARLALARSVVAADARKGAANCQRREETWERMTQHHRLTTADPGAPAVPFGPLRIGCDCGAPRGVTCADHYTGEPK